MWMVTKKSISKLGEQENIKKLLFYWMSDDWVSNLDFRWCVVKVFALGDQEPGAEELAWNEGSERRQVSVCWVDAALSSVLALQWVECDGPYASWGSTSVSRRLWVANGWQFSWKLMCLRGFVCRINQEPDLLCCGTAVNRVQLMVVCCLPVLFAWWSWINEGFCWSRLAVTIIGTWIVGSYKTPNVRSVTSFVDP